MRVKYCARAGDRLAWPTHHHWKPTFFSFAGVSNGTTRPRLAQLAYAERCAQRVLPEYPDMAIPDVAETVARVARFLFEKVSIDTPLTGQLRCIRRDFIRLKRLAREQQWTDGTPVPPDVFGPLWPQGIAPDWAVKTVESIPPAVE